MATDKDDQDDFLVESVDADDEMSVNLNSSPFKNGDQLEERWGNGEAKHTELHQDRRELQPSNKQAACGVEKTPETNSQKPSRCLCSIMFSSPEVHIPRKQKPKEGYTVALNKPHTDQVAEKADKEVGELNTLGQPIYSCGLLVAHSCDFFFPVKSNEHSEENKLLFYWLLLVEAFPSKRFLFSHNPR